MVPIPTAIPRLVKVKIHPPAFSPERNTKLMIRVMIKGRNIIEITFPLAGLLVSPIRYTRRLRLRYINGTATKLLTIIQGLMMKPICGTKNT